MEKIVEIAVLFDYYGKLLSEKQYNVVDQYCNEDLSLREIAEINGVSKQGISDILNRAEKKLRFYEDELQLIKKFVTTNEALKNINDFITDNLNVTSEEDFVRVLDIIYKENEKIIENTL